jgi:hypothetical protein
MTPIKTRKTFKHVVDFTFTTVMDYFTISHNREVKNYLGIRIYQLQTCRCKIKNHPKRWLDLGNIDKSAKLFKHEREFNL